MCSVFTVDAGLDAAIPDASLFDANISDASDIDATVGCGDGVVDPGNDEVCDDFNTDSDDGCSDQCLVEAGFICISEPSECHTPPGPGELIISEIHKDPNAVNDPLGEWFEIFNPTSETFQLLNMVIMDDGVEQTVVDSPLTIGPSETLVFGNNADIGTNGGVVIDFAYPEIEFILGNNNDEIVLLEPFGNMQIDRVDYRDATFPDTTGSSLSLNGSAYSPISNNIGANWCEGQSSFGDGDLGTPGAVNPDC